MATAATQNNHWFFERSQWISMALARITFKYLKEREHTKHPNLIGNWNKEQCDSNQRGGRRGIIGDNLRGGGAGIKEHV